MRRNPTWPVALAVATAFAVLAIALPVKERSSAPTFRFPKIRIDALDLKRYARDASMTHRLYLRTAYIGKIAKHATLDYNVTICPSFQLLTVDTVHLFGRSRLMPGDPKYLDPGDDRIDLGWQTHRWAVPQWVRLDVDTTVDLAGRLSKKERQGRMYAVCLTNESLNTVWLGSNDELTIDFQVWQNEEWITIASSSHVGCGYGRYSFYLPPGEMALTVLPVPDDRSRKYRLVAGSGVSNTFH